MIMNDRIETLAKAAGYDMINKAAMRALGFDKEKFAELIVLECAVIVGSMEEPHQDIAKLIKQHFGVE